MKRVPLVVASQTLSLPVGSDGFVLKGSPNWGFDSRFWIATIGQIGAVGRLDQPAFGQTVSSTPIPAAERDNWPLSLTGKQIRKADLKLVHFGQRDLYEDNDAEYRVKPYYIFPAGLNGYVYCPGLSQTNARPKMNSCDIHIRDHDVEHSFHIAEGQIDLAATVSKVFLATLKAG